MSWNEIVELVQRAQGGDRCAYGELVKRLQPAVYAVALARLRNPNEAQELTQEVFIHGMTKLAQLRDARCFAGWLRQITVRMAINRVTRKAPWHGAEPELLQNAAAGEDGPLDAILRSEARAEVARAVAIVRYYAQLCLLPDGETLPAAGPDGLLMSRRRPVGVAALVTPWNFPVAIPLWKAAPALAVTALSTGPAGTDNSTSLESPTSNSYFFSDRAARPCGRHALVAWLGRKAR